MQLSVVAGPLQFCCYTFCVCSPVTVCENMVIFFDPSRSTCLPLLLLLSSSSLFLLPLSVSQPHLLFSISATGDSLNEAIKTLIFISNMRFNRNFSQYYYNRRTHMAQGGPIPTPSPPALRPFLPCLARSGLSRNGIATANSRMLNANAIQFNFPPFSDCQYWSTASQPKMPHNAACVHIFATFRCIFRACTLG